MNYKSTISIFLTAVIIVVASSFNAPQQSDKEEYVLKAAFIYRFTDYIEWENNNDKENFTIGVLGKSAITAPLNEIAGQKKIKGKTIAVKEYDNANDAANCQVIFVSGNYSSGIESILPKTGNKAVLIIAEQKGACLEGADINFLLTDNKLKFEVNLDAAEKVGLRISSQLLQHAILVSNP